MMLFCAGMPLVFLEVGLGQFAGAGPIKIFGRMAPIARGLGYVSFWSPKKLLFRLVETLFRNNEIAV